MTMNEQPDYLQQMKDESDDAMKTSLQALYDAGYIDFEENKIMIESNPAMSLDDIMACIDESKKEDEGTKIVDLDDEAESSDVAAGEYDEKDIEEMNKLVGNVLDSNTETDPENELDQDEKKVEEETKVASDSKAGATDISKVAEEVGNVRVNQENKNPNAKKIADT